MKIGIWVDSPIDKNSGGSYTYAKTLISGIDDFVFDPRVEIVFISNYALPNLNKPSINISAYQQGISYLKKSVRKGLKLTSASLFNNAITGIDKKEKALKDASAAAYLKGQGIKLIFYPTPLSHVIDGIPFIVNNWDLAHYTTYAFPEITDNDGFNKRNSWYVEVATNALMVFSETEAGKQELSQYLNINADKIKVFPLFSSSTFKNLQVDKEKQLSVLKTLGLTAQKFFFYPAQFWAHKNHYNLIKAFEHFNKQFPEFKLFLCGSDKGNLQYLKSMTSNNAIIFGGFIDDDSLYTMYKNATALVMPTFLGPSNIPPIEALLLGCPVLCSDLKGHKEIMGNAALYFDALDATAMADCMKQVTDDATRTSLLQNQSEVSKTTNHTIEKALQQMEKHFIEAINIRNCWE